MKSGVKGMINQEVFTHLVNQYVESQTSSNTELTLDLMILYQLLTIKERYSAQEQSLDAHYSNRDSSEDLANLEFTVDSMIEKNRKQLKEILDSLQTKDQV